jgi:hypothetical protein
MPMLRKALTATALAIVLASVPTHLAAQVREAPTKIQAVSALEWFSGIWHHLATLFATETTPPAKPGNGPTTDSGCSWDPWGRCGS